MEEEQYYEQVETEDDVEDVEVGDVAFITASVLIGCLVIAFVFRQIKVTFKNVHLKIGNKVEIGVETKDSNIKEEN